MDYIFTLKRGIYALAQDLVEVSEIAMLVNVAKAQQRLAKKPTFDPGVLP